MKSYILTLFTLYGLIIGSFLNVCIYRIPKSISVAKGRSYCPSCHHSLFAKDLIPVFSYLLLGGKCRYCKERISPRYALVELLTAIMFGLCYYFFGISVQAFLACALVSVLIIVSFIDLDTQEINDAMSIIIFALAVINLFFDGGIPMKLGGFFAVSVPMFLIAYTTGGFGGGDIKLMAAAGLYLGAVQIALAFFIGAFFAAFYGVYLLAIKKADRKTAFAFGPFLCMGIMTALFVGERLLGLYLSIYQR